jgi:hypothetical protein
MPRRSPRFRTRSTSATASGASRGADLPGPDQPVAEDPRPAWLAEQIRAAFADVPQPDPSLTIGAGPLEHGVEQALAGKSADDLEPADALAVRLDLWTLTPEAFQYYVPALTRMFLVGDTAVDALGEGIMTALTPSEDPAIQEKLDERVGALDDAQRKALGDFVCWYLDVEELVPRADAALAYWDCG